MCLVQTNLSICKPCGQANCTYKVGVDATVISLSFAEMLFGPIFDNYLNDNLYATGLVPCNFSSVYLTSFEEARAAVKNRSLSFVFGNPSMTSCFSVSLSCLSVNILCCQFFHRGSLQPPHELPLAFMRVLVQWGTRYMLFLDPL